MPSKKVSKNIEANKFDFQKLIQSSDSYKSLIYGIITVIVLAVVLFLGVNTLSKNKAQITENAATTQRNLEKEKSLKSYTVSEGDTLSSIAEAKYGDGSKWNVIAKANNITNPSNLEKGTRLTIPEVAKETVTQTKVTTSTTNVNIVSSDKKISGNSYTIVLDDNLWDIAVRAYGDGYRWMEIAKVNNLANPDMIFSGNVLKLPRP